MNKYELPVYRELILCLEEEKNRIQDILDDIDSDIKFYRDKIIEYEASKTSI